MKLEPGVPYFGPEMIANHGDEKHLPFAPVARLVLRSSQSPKVLEVGSWAGCSLAAWDRAFGGAAQFTVVDSWNPDCDWDPHSEVHQIMGEAAKSGAIWELFCHNIRACGMVGRIVVMQGDSLVLLPRLPSASFDLAYIDGDHRYDWVKRDIINTKALIRDGGIICGDDLEIQLHQLLHHQMRAHKACLDAGRDYFEQGRPGGTPRGQPPSPGYHVGVTQAVGEIFGPVSSIDAMWAMRRVGDSWRPINLTHAVMIRDNRLARRMIPAGLDNKRRILSK
jgi:hypothetical protein